MTTPRGKRQTQTNNPRKSTDKRGVSIAITHSLTIAITAVLLSVLLISSGNLLQSQEQRVAQSQFDEIGADVVAQVNSLDRLNRSGVAETGVKPSYPERIAGKPWQMEFTDTHNFDTRYALNITTEVFDRTLQYPIDTSVDIDVGARPENSEVPVIRLCDHGEITFTECS